MSKYERKVTKIGNSYGITVPADLLKEAGISYGDEVQLELKEGKIVVEKKEEIKLPDGVDNDFIEVLNDVIFLKLNGYQWMMGIEEEQRFIVDIVKHVYTFQELVQTAESQSKKE